MFDTTDDVPSPARFARRAAFITCVALQSLSAQDTSAPPGVFSIGQPPRSLTYADALAERSDGHFRNGLLIGGMERSLLNPVVGMMSGAGEGYASVGSLGSSIGIRGIARSPALALGVGIDWNITRGRADALLTYRSAILRGGLLGHGTMLRVDWIPKRNNTLAVGIDVPLNQPLAGRTRPRHLDVSLPDLRSPQTGHAALPPAVESALGDVESAARGIRACSSIWRDSDVRDVVAAGSCTDAERRYHASLRRAFVLVAGSDSVGSVVLTRVRAGLLSDVLLPFDTVFAQVKDPTDRIGGLSARAHQTFTRWLSDSSRIAPAMQIASMAVYARLLAIVEDVHRELLGQWNDSRYVWLPLRLALTPDQFDEQTEVDALIGRAVGRPFTDDNAVTYLRSRDLPLEIARSIYAARDYHVLWTHDVTSRRHGTHNIDNVGYEMVADAYFPALTAAVKRYDATGKLPAYMIFLDQYFYEPRGGRLWMTILEDPLNASVALPEEDPERANHLRQRQQELRDAVAASRRLQQDAGRWGGEKWIARTVKVHVNITDPSDFSFRSGKLVPPFPFAPDNLMRDHRKIVFYDLTEADPYRGVMLMMGTGVGEQFASATWEDRGIRVRGPAALEARAALRRVMRANSFRESEVPIQLREVTSGREAERRLNVGDYIGRALQVHNEVGWGAKKASVVRAILYDLVEPGSLVIVPDPQWASPHWAALLAGAAARGARVNVVAPALLNAPTPEPTLQALVHDVLLRFIEMREMLAEPMRSSGGQIHVGLFAGRAQVNDPAGRRAEVREGLLRNPWLREIFPFDAATLSVLDSSEARATRGRLNATAIARDEIPREPKMHQKTQLIARPGAIANLLRQPGWSNALADVIDVQAEETAELTEQLTRVETPAVDVSAARRTDAMLRGFEQGMSPAERKRVSFYFSVGTMNQDPRGMALDGEASVVTSGFSGAAGFVDLYYLMARSTWVDDKVALEKLLPQGNGIRTWLAKLFWSTM